MGPIRECIAAVRTAAATCLSTQMWRNLYLCLRHVLDPCTPVLNTIKSLHLIGPIYLTDITPTHYRYNLSDGCNALIVLSTVRASIMNMSQTRGLPHVEFRYMGVGRHVAGSGPTYSNVFHKVGPLSATALSTRMWWNSNMCQASWSRGVCDPYTRCFQHSQPSD